MSAATDQSGISPQECLLLGISHHEADRLEESAYWFEKAANENGGCGVGMFMWGLSLRHAWGVERDERAAFWWLRRAAECAVQDMERTTQARPEGGDASDVEKERDRKAVQSELVLAVYEVGQCFFHGWGVETDKRMAVVSLLVKVRNVGLNVFFSELLPGSCASRGHGCPT
jgi:TPR repeat protein